MTAIAKSEGEGGRGEGEREVEGGWVSGWWGDQVLKVI